MKKILFALAAVLFLHQLVQGQDVNSAVRHYPGKVKYDRTEQDATIFEVPYPKDEVEEGMKKMLGQRGVKIKEKNGFYEAKNVKILKLENKIYDAYYKVEKDGKTASKIYIILTEPGEAVVGRNSSHAVIAAAAGGTAVAAAVGSSLTDHNFENKVKEQEADIKDAERKYADLQDDQRRLQKKFDDLQKELDKNAQDQSRLQKEIEAKKKILEEFKSGKTGKKS